MRGGKLRASDVALRGDKEFGRGLAGAVRPRGGVRESGGDCAETSMNDRQLLGLAEILFFFSPVIGWVVWEAWKLVTGRRTGPSRPAGAPGKPRAQPGRTDFFGLSRLKR